MIFQRGGVVGVFRSNLICSHRLPSNVFQPVPAHSLGTSSTNIWFMLTDSPWITMCRLIGDTLSSVSAGVGRRRRPGRIYGFLVSRYGFRVAGDQASDWLREVAGGVGMWVSSTLRWGAAALSPDLLSPRGVGPTFTKHHKPESKDLIWTVVTAKKFSYFLLFLEDKTAVLSFFLLSWQSVSSGVWSSTEIKYPPTHFISRSEQIRKTGTCICSFWWIDVVFASDIQRQLQWSMSFSSNMY